MSYEISYFPTFLANLNIWINKKFSNQCHLEKAFETKKKLIRRHLDNEFAPISQKYSNIKTSDNGKIPHIIWIMWWQGENSMPEIPKACLKSVRKWASAWDIRIITKENYQKYIDLSDVINYSSQYCFNQQRLTIQYMSDLVRMRILYKYGGLWLDATMFALNNRIFDLLDTQSFFTIKLDEKIINNHKLNSSIYTPGKGGFCDSVWGTYPQNPFFEFINECMTLHLHKHKTVWDYFIIEYSILICLENCRDIARQFDKIPISNPDLYWLEKHAFDRFEQSEFEKINLSSSIFKLNWKMKSEEKKVTNGDSFLDHILSL